MNKWLSLLLVFGLLVGCSAQEEDDSNVVIESHTGSYAYKAPYESNHIRFHHASKDSMEIGEGLFELSKEYFSVNDYLLSEGQVIDEYEAEFLPLIHRRESKENPIGLNPSRDTELDLGKGQKVKGPFIIHDLYEINFMNKGNSEELAGIAMALVVHDTVEDDKGRKIKIDDDILYEISINAGRKLESYLRKSTEVADIPMLLTVFAVDPENQSIPGRYIAKGYFENRQGQFEKLNHQWMIFPTQDGSTSDATVNSQIISMKKAVDGFLPEDVSMVAYGEYWDDTLKKLNVDVTVQAKTYTEIAALTNTLAELIMSFDTNSDVLVRVHLVNDVIAIIQRPVGKNAKIIMIGQ